MNNKKIKREKIPYVLNCVKSRDIEEDWTFADAVHAGLVDEVDELPLSVDMRKDWWKVRDQKDTGACVGFATADGVLKWHYVQNGLIGKKDDTSPRFIWMANKEMDEINSFPTTFLEQAGTQTKIALKIARKYGCVLEKDLPMSGKLSSLEPQVFYIKAARLRIASFHNIPYDVNAWRKWLAQQGPILTRLDVEDSWMRAGETHGHLRTYDPDSVVGGHAIAVVGYTQDYFIIRNSWGTGWGDDGFAYASLEYADEAFWEGYGVIL